MPITVTHAKSDTIGDFTGTVTLYNSSGGTTTGLATDLVRPSDWNSAHAVSMSVTASEIASLFNFGTGLSSTTAAGGISVGLAGNAYFEPFPLHNTNSTLSAPGIGTWYFDGPYNVDPGWNKGQINVLMSNAAGFLHGTTFSAASTGSVSRYMTLWNKIALYTQGAGASTSRLESFWTAMNSYLATWSLGLNTANTSSGTITNALTLSFPAQWDSVGGVTYSSTAQSASSAFGTSTAASTRADSLITGAVAYLSGARMDPIAISTTIPAGVYWVAHMLSSSSSTAGTAGGIGTAGVAFSTHSRLGLLENLVNAYKRLGLSVSNSSTNMPLFHGYLATTSSNATAIVNTGDIRGTTGRMYWNFNISTY